MAIELNASKLKIYEFVESRMTYIAPNLSVIIGASTAAKLMGIVFVIRLHNSGEAYQSSNVEEMSFQVLPED